MLFFRVGVLMIAACIWLTGGSIASAQNNTVSNDLPTSNELRAGAAAIAEGRYDDALQQFAQSIARSPAIGYGNRCLVHLQMQHYSAAIEDCTQSLAITENAEVMLNLGLAYEQAGEHTLAIAQYEKMIAANIADYRVHYNLALSEAAVGEQQAAVASYTRSLRVLPKNAQTTIQADIYRDRGASYLVLADYAAAVTDFNAAISRDPNDVWAYFNRGCAYHRSNNFLPALQDFSWVIEQDSRNAHAYFNRGIIYARLHQPEAAIENLTQALQRFPTNAQSEDILIPVHQAHHLIEQLKKGEPNSAIFSFLGDRPVSS